LIGWLLEIANACICGYDKHVCLVYIDENDLMLSTSWLYIMKARLKYMVIFVIEKLVARGDT
jgi:hypothetical protein